MYVNGSIINMTQILSVTQARNNFFDIVNTSYLEEQEFIIKKGGIPLVRISPLTCPPETKEADPQVALLEKIRKNREEMKKTPSSTPLIRKMRRDRVMKQL